MKCKRATATSDVVRRITKNERVQQYGSCNVCGKNKCTFVKSGGGVAWTDNLAEELHKPVRKKFYRRRIWVPGVDHTWAADLVEMTAFAKENDGYRYLLTVIDVFSKYGWITPLKNKTGEVVANALRDILKQRKPKKLWVDKGKEFYNRHVQALVPIYSTENEEKSSVVERWNRTMKERMYKFFSANNTYRYLDMLDGLVDTYNNSRHSSIGMTPVKASDPANEDSVRAKLYPLLKTPQKPKFAVEDRGRIPRKKGTFEKGYTPRWTEEVFTINQVLYTNPITYRIVDHDGEKIEGSFYESELQKTAQEVYRIERVIRRRGKKALVKWLGYPDSQNSWVDADAIQDL